MHQPYPTLLIEILPLIHSLSVFHCPNCKLSDGFEELYNEFQKGQINILSWDISHNQLTSESFSFFCKILSLLDRQRKQ